MLRKSQVLVNKDRISKYYFQNIKEKKIGPNTGIIFSGHMVVYNF